MYNVAEATPLTSLSAGPRGGGGESDLTLAAEVLTVGECGTCPMEFEIVSNVGEACRSKGVNPICLLTIPSEQVVVMKSASIRRTCFRHRLKVESDLVLSVREIHSNIKTPNAPVDKGL